MTTFCNYFAKFGLAIAFLAMLPAVALLWPDWREWIPGLSQSSPEPQAKLTIEGPAHSGTIASLAPPTESRQRLVVARREPVYRQGQSIPQNVPLETKTIADNHSGSALPAPRSAEPSLPPVRPDSAKDRVGLSQDQIERRLRKRGARYYRLEVSDDAEEARYHFYCEAVDESTKAPPRKFTAQADDRITAMEQVLRDLESWQASELK